MKKKGWNLSKRCHKNNSDSMIIDRIEENMAVCETSDGQLLDVLKEKLPAGCKEGDILEWDKEMDRFEVDKQKTEEKNAEVSSRFERLKRKKD